MELRHLVRLERAIKRAHKAHGSRPELTIGKILHNALDPNRVDRPPLELWSVSDGELISRIMAYGNDAEES